MKLPQWTFTFGKSVFRKQKKLKGGMNYRVAPLKQDANYNHYSQKTQKDQMKLNVMQPAMQPVDRQQYKQNNQESHPRRNKTIQRQYQDDQSEEEIYDKRHQRHRSQSKNQLNQRDTANNENLQYKKRQKKKTQKLSCKIVSSLSN